MGRKSHWIASHAALASFGAVLSISLLFVFPALAAPGDVLQRVDIPAQSRCAKGDTGNSLGLVPGSAIGRDEFPVLLVTSCLRSRLNSLIFLDPSTNPAAEVRVIFTRVMPRGGWRALTLRPERGDLLACEVTAGEQHVYQRVARLPQHRHQVPSVSLRVR
jgi:hypothetical protein